MPSASVLARGGMDRIGGEGSVHRYQIGDADAIEQACSLPDHARAIDEALARLVGSGGVLQSIEELAAVGFKAVHARSISGVVELDDDVVGRMEDFYPQLRHTTRPTWRPCASLSAWRRRPAASAALKRRFTGRLRCAVSSMPCPTRYEEYGVKRYGFHGASHRYAAEKVIELEGRDDLRHVNMHLGGSSSLCMIKGGVSLGASHGLSPQGGLPQNNRIGDLDPYALDLVMRNRGLSLARRWRYALHRAVCRVCAVTTTCAIYRRVPLLATSAACWRQRASPRRRAII